MITPTQADRRRLSDSTVEFISSVKTLRNIDAELDFLCRNKLVNFEIHTHTRLRRSCAYAKVVTCGDKLRDMPFYSGPDNLKDMVTQAQLQIEQDLGL